MAGKWTGSISAISKLKNRLLEVLFDIEFLVILFYSVSYDCSSFNAYPADFPIIGRLRCLWR